MSRAFLSGVAGLLLLLFALPAPAAAITYNVQDNSVPGVSLDGFITTDNTIGILTEANITNFGFTYTIVGFLGSPFIANKIGIVGTALLADATNLYFDFSVPNSNFRIWVLSNPPDDSSFINYFIWISALLGQPGAIGAFPNFIVAVPPQLVIIGQISETPLPAALPLFATVLGGTGLIAWWRRKRKAAAQAAVA